MKKNFKMPQYDPQTGDKNPYLIDLKLRTEKQPDPKKHQQISFNQISNTNHRLCLTTF